MPQSTQSRLGCRPVIGKVLDRRYRIIGYLGSGSFAKTYLAVDIRRPGHPECVIKHIRPVHNTPKSLLAARRRFQREAQILEKLGKHDQIPQLLAYFQSKQEFCLVEEYVPGKPLLHELLPGQPLSEDKTIDLLQQLLEILAFVHAHQVIHRDVTPTNIIRRETDNKLVLIDFGAVKEIGIDYLDEQSHKTKAAGTPAYMPLEQYRGYPQFNSDIYALGTIAIQGLAGVSAIELPKLKNPRTPNCAEKVWRDRTQVSQELADLIDKMVCDDYNQRYQSAEEVLADLKKMTARSVVEDLPPTVIFFPEAPSQALPAVGASGRLSGEQVDSLLRWLTTIGVAALAIGGLIWAFQSRTHLKAKELYDSGMHRAKSGDRAGALEDYTQAIALLPSNADAYDSRGKVRFQLGDFQGAIDDYTRALELNPDLADTYDRRCHAQLSLKRFENALSDCARAIQLNANLSTAYKNRCVVYYSLGAYQRAIDDCTRTIQLNAEDAEAYNNRGLARSAIGDRSGATQDFTRALQLNSNPGAETALLMPATADAYALRCSAQLNLQNWQGALSDCTQAIRLNPRHADAYNARCLTHLKRGALRTAMNDCTRAIQLNPMDASAYSNRGLARSLAVDGAGALGDFSRAVQLNPKYGDAYRLRGMAYYDLADYEKAIADLTRALQLNPKDADAYSSRGRTYYQLAQYPLAIADFTAAIRLLPHSEIAFFGRGKSRAQIGDEPGAIEDFHKAAKLCIDKGITACYTDAQLEIKKLQK